MTPFTLVGLFPTVYTLVTLQVVLLDETHITYVTLKWLLTGMNKDVPLEVITAPKGSKAVFTNKIFGNLYLKRTILFHYHHLGARVRRIMRLPYPSAPSCLHSALALFSTAGQSNFSDAVISHIPQS